MECASPLRDGQTEPNVLRDGNQWCCTEVVVVDKADSICTSERCAFARYFEVQIESALNSHREFSLLLLVLLRRYYMSHDAEFPSFPLHGYTFNRSFLVPRHIISTPFHRSQKSYDIIIYRCYFFFSVFSPAALGTHRTELNQTLPQYNIGKCVKFACARPKFGVLNPNKWRPKTANFVGFQEPHELITNIFGKKHDIDNRKAALGTTNGLLHSPEIHELW